MSLDDSIKELVVRDIGGRTVYMLDVYARVNHRVISALHNLEILKDADLDKAIEKAVANTARKDFGLILNKGYWPDHVGSPECLSYAIQNAILSHDDVRRIKFDHGQNAYSFCKQYNSIALIPKLREKFLNPIEQKRSAWEECACCC